MAITLSPETRRRVIDSIKRYFDEELDQEIGELRAGFVLDFLLKEVGPSIHNSAIVDAQARMQERVSELDESCFEPEFCYWQR